MELILLKDVENLGFADDIVKVKPGYGRNFLIPQGYALLATISERKQLAEKLKQRAHKEEKLIQDAKATAEKLGEINLKIKQKVGKENKLFGSVNNITISENLSNLGFSIDKKFIKVIGTNLKKLGKFNAIIRLHRDISKELEFEIVAEN